MMYRVYYTISPVARVSQPIVHIYVIQMRCHGVFAVQVRAPKKQC